MAHEIDSMFYTGETPWHKLGTRLDEPATAEQAIKAAGLDWEVHRQKLYTGLYRETPIKDRYAVVRTDRLDRPDGGVLGVCGRDYTPLSNRDAFSFLDPVVDQDEAVYHTAGSLRGGRRVWMLAKLPGEVRVVGDDIVERYLLLSNSHDGTSSVRILPTSIRVVCANTLSFALRGSKGIRIRHNQDVVQRVKQATQLLGIVRRGFGDAEAVMKKLAQTQVTQDRLDAYFEQVMPIDLVDNERDRERTRKRHDRWRELFETGDGNGLPGVRGTLWAGVNAITQHTDRESYTPRNREPLNSIWFGQGERLKRRAFEVAERMVGVELN